MYMYTYICRTTRKIQFLSIVFFVYWLFWLSYLIQRFPFMGILGRGCVSSLQLSLSPNPKYQCVQCDCMCGILCTNLR